LNTEKSDFVKEDLDNLLKIWRPDVPEPFAFKRSVWRRIEQRARPAEWLEHFFALFTRPKTASLAAALSLVGGALVGFAIGAQGGQAAYLHAVDPYAQVASK
jgi:hypothetical protein